MRLAHFKRALCVCLVLERCLRMDRQAGRWDGKPLAARTLHLRQPVGPLCGMFRLPQQREEGKSKGGDLPDWPALAVLEWRVYWNAENKSPNRPDASPCCHCCMAPGGFLAHSDHDWQFLLWLNLYTVEKKILFTCSAFGSKEFHMQHTEKDTIEIPHVEM